MTSGLPPAMTAELTKAQLENVVRALDTNRDGVLQNAELPLAPEVVRALDGNGNGRLEVGEVVSALQQDQFVIGLKRDQALKALIQFDKNNDGYIGLNELEMTYNLMQMVDGYGAEAYADVNDKPMRDAAGKRQPTGAVKSDGRISLSEMANAMADGRLLVASRIFEVGLLAQQ